jgi:hypothetical protein
MTAAATAAVAPTVNAAPGVAVGPVLQLQPLHQEQTEAIKSQHPTGPKPGQVGPIGINGGEEGQGHGLGAAGNVARQHQGGAEFPQGPGKTEADAGHQTRQGQGQGDASQHPQFRGPEAAGHLGQGWIDLFEGRQGRAIHQRKGHHRRTDHRGRPAEDNLNAAAMQQRTQRAVTAQQLQQQETQHGGRQHQGREQQ